MTLSDLNEDQRLELKQSHLSKKMGGRVPHLHAQMGIEWALQRLLDHIEAVR